MYRRSRVSTAIVVVLTALLGTAGISAQAEIDPAMAALWERSDLPVANLSVSRSWLWGPQANHVLYEPYVAETLDDGQRLVAYFDKSRMEINDPGGDPDSIWHVTNGLLVVELVTGRIQIGANEFEPAIPSRLNVVGDQGATSPTYSDIEENLDQEPHAEGELIDSYYTWFAAGPGFTGKIAWAIIDGSTDETILSQDIRAAHYVPETNHTIAAPFWEFMNSTGPVYEDGQYVEGPLFHNPFLATGLPITEANWTQEAEGAVLFQCFERRCLTYTPSNPEGWQVEAGNVGQHYWTWRHEQGGNPCGLEPAQTFSDLWLDDAELRSRLRCPEPLYGDGRSSIDTAIATAYQPFEHGAMLWTENDYGYYFDRQVYVLYDDGNYERYVDSWDDSQPVDDPSIIPPSGFYQPVAGFGNVWREMPGVRDRLGWATEPESPSAGEIQPFERGEMIWRESEDHIWVFYGDRFRAPAGDWGVYEGTVD